MEENSPTIMVTKPVTIQKIAEELGIHKSTVSLALSGKGRVAASTRQRIVSFAAERGYEPDLLAQRLASRARNNMVCLCSGILDVGRATEKILLIQSELSGHGLEVPIYTSGSPSGDSGKSQAALFRQLRRQRPLAIVCSTYGLNSVAFKELETYQREGGIVVSYDFPIPLQCDQVLYDREDNAYQGARYLLERGHQHIGIGMSRITRPVSDMGNVPQTLRLQGFRRAMAEFGQPVREEWLFENTTFEKGGAEMAQHFLELKKRPTALCIVNDYVALAFMIEIMRAGLSIPADVSIVGHDDQPIASYCPVPLTSVSQPAEEIVRAVITMLMERIEGSTLPARTMTVQSQLVERQSVANIAQTQTKYS